MDAKKIYRYAAETSEAASLTCVVLAYAGAYTAIFGCPSVGATEVIQLVLAAVLLKVPEAYFAGRVKMDSQWIENSYRCPNCGAEWLDFDDGPAVADCFTCGEENVAPFSSRPFQ